MAWRNRIALYEEMNHGKFLDSADWT
jgi:hypothetical protein